MYDISIAKKYRTLTATKNFDISFDEDNEFSFGDSDQERIAIFRSYNFNLSFTGGVEFHNELKTAKNPNEAWQIAMKWVLKYFSENTKEFTNYLRDFSASQRAIGRDEKANEIRKSLGLLRF